jgi:hypothetical protein
VADARRRSESARLRLAGPLAVAVLAVALRLIYGPGHAGYDAAWALVWGDELTSGRLPSFEAPVAPTPHPLSNVVSMLANETAIVAISFLSLAALAWVMFRLGQELFSPWVGVLAAVIVVTRPLLVAEAKQALIDVPFLALVVGAAVREARRPRTDPWVPVLLCLAGLLRPEGWLAALAWLAWSWAPSSPRERLRNAAIVAAAPVLWALFDLIVTGDPLHSLHGTQELAAALERPREASTAFATAPSYLKYALREPVVWLGFAGAAAGLLWRYERSLLPAAIAGLGLGAFLALGVAGLPLLVRYLLLPAVMLALFGALAALGWTTPGEGRRAWMAAGAVALVALAIGLPGDVRAVRDAVAFTDEREAIHADLRELTDELDVACDAVWVPDHRARPLVALWLDLPPDRVRTGLPAQDEPGLVLTYATPAAAERFALNLAQQPPAGDAAAPPGRRRIAANRSWRAYARCEPATS